MLILNHLATGTINAAVEFRPIELQERFSFRRVIALSELDLIRVGSLSDRFGIPGQSEESAIFYISWRKMDFLLILKPRDGSGSINTVVIRERNAPFKYLTQGVAPNLTMEKFVLVEMYHIDDLVTGGWMRFASISRYLNGCLAFQSGNYLGSHIVVVDNPMHSRINEFVTKLLNSLPTPENTVIHAEVFHTPDDWLVFCEIASHAGGTRILETVRRAYGANLVGISVQTQCGLDISAEIVTDLKLLEYTCFLLTPPRKGTFVHSPVPIE
jgi:hypothetical protein